ncbi:MAG TPA: Lrp/AsnC family transcriptional regulator [Candidatus Binatia bacterium]|nr:Lrp/AsnC family transcriptional regulator [Candidatus Binatia bacterium]
MDYDDKDLRILELLKENSNATSSKISKKLNIPITTVHNRIKKLQQTGVIQHYTVELDYKKLEKGMLAYVLVNVVYTLPSGKKIHQENVARDIKKIGAEEVSIVAGGADIMVKVRAKDVEDLNDFVVKKLRSIDGVDKTQTMIVLQSV